MIWQGFEEKRGRERRGFVEVQWKRWYKEG